MKIGRGVSFVYTSSGAQSFLTGTWDHLTCDFSRIIEYMGENLPLLTNLIPEGGTRPMIFGLDRNQGGYLDPDQTLEPAMMHLSVPPDSKGITKVK